LLEVYLGQRESLVGLVLTVDIRRGLTPLDDTLLRWLEPRELPVAILLTKADKLSRGAGLARQRLVAEQVGGGARLVRFSAVSRDGVSDVREWLADWLKTTD
jgi:GTP-binding protein